MASPSSSPTFFAAVGVFFAAVAVLRLAVPGYVDLGQGAIALALAVGSALFVWARRGGPAWAESAGKVAYALGVAIGLGTIVADMV
ncbi:hypothetical protein [Rubrivirga sp. IMCC45206]|uniref:hypothetical protein n=1 Tax=Rubrivirga sp. IMCC45206 TaxID=3391614 RepID=UPI00398FCFC1